MAAWGYEFYLLVLILSALEDKIRIPARPCNILFFLHTLQSFEIVRKLDCPDPEIQTRYVIKFTMVSET